MHRALHVKRIFIFLKVVTAAKLARKCFLKVVHLDFDRANPPLNKSSLTVFKLKFYDISISMTNVCQVVLLISLRS